MGRAGRFACIFLPLCATAATAILIIVGVMIGQTNRSSGFENSLYFIRLDTRYIKAPSTLDLVPGTNLDNIVENLSGVNVSIENTAKLIGLPDFYQAGFWGYCSGTFSNTSGTNSWNVQNCSSPKGFFSFNIIDIINSDVTSGGNITFPSAVNNAFKAVNAVSRASFICFLVGIIATGVEFAVGWFGLLSRIGSCVTTLVANLAFYALLAGAVLNIILYNAMKVAFNETYNTFGVKASINGMVYRLMFIGVALSLAAATFWLFSSCCCSGRRDKVMRGDGGRRGERTSRGGGSDYEKVASPYSTPLMGGSSQQYGQTSYEPMRHQPV